MGRRSKLGIFAALSLLAVACGPAPDTGSGPAGSTGAGGSKGTASGGGGSTSSLGPSDQGGGAVDATVAQTAPGMTSGAGGAGVPGDLQGCPAEADRKTTVTTLTAPNPRLQSSVAETRATLQAGKAPDPSAIRTAELLEYYAPSYDANPGPDPKLTVEMTTTPSGEYLFQVGLTAPDHPASRQALDLTVLVDTSSSMAGDSMARARSAVKTLALSLQKGDVVNLVATSPEIAPRTFPIQSSNDLNLIQAVNDLTTGGDGSLDRALDTAYQLTLAKGSPDFKRLVLISDAGVAPADVDLGKVTAHQTNDGVAVVGLGVGPAIGYRSALLDAFAIAGRGAHLYLDDLDAGAVEGRVADSVLVRRFDGLFGAAASGVTVTVATPWFFTPHDENDLHFATDSAVTTLPQYDIAYGQTLVFRQVLHPCAPAAPSVCKADFTVSAAWSGSDPQKAPSFTLAVGDILTTSPRIAKASAVVAFADALRSQDPGHLEAAYELASAIDGDADMTEIAGLIQLHPLYPKGK